MVILTPAGDHLPGSYTYRTEDQRLIGRIFSARSRQDYEAALAQFRADLGVAPLETDPLADLSDQSRAFIERQ